MILNTSTVVLIVSKCILTILFIFPVATYAESDVHIDLTNRNEFYAAQYMCISDAVSCAFDISEKVNPDKEAEVEKAKENCCLKLAYCSDLVDAIHPTVYDLESETVSKDTAYTNKVNDTYQATCMAAGTNEPLRLPSATKLK